MSGSTPAKPRVAFLGAREQELDLIALLHRQDAVELVAIYDPDPQVVGVQLAEVLGVPAGSDASHRQRLLQADFIVTGHDILRLEADIDWARKQSVPMLSLEDGRKRWGSLQLDQAIKSRTWNPKQQLRQFTSAMRRLQEGRQLGEWLLETAMRSVNASGGSIQLLAPGTSDLYLLTARGLSERIVRNVRHPLGKPISGVVAAKRQPQLIQDDRDETESIDRGPIRSAISYPLVAEGDVLVGVLNVSSDVEGVVFDESHMELIGGITPQMSQLLSTVRGDESRRFYEGQAQLLDVFRRLEADNAKLPQAMKVLAGRARSLVQAESVSLLLFTEEGDWLELGSSRDDSASFMLAPSRAHASQAYLEKRWLHITETIQSTRPGPAPADQLSDAVDAAFAAEPAAVTKSSRVYVPLSGVAPLGVASFVFAEPKNAEQFLQQSEGFIQQVGLYVEARVREHASERKQHLLAQVAQSVPRLLECADRASFDETTLRIAHELLPSRRVFFRRVDERQRTYSRPRMIGVSQEDRAAWVELDGRITEFALQRGETLVRGTIDQEQDAIDRENRYRTLLSVPVHDGGRRLAILNFYDKLARDLLDGFSFSRFERNLAESLATIVGTLLAAGRGRNSPAANAAPSSQRRQGEVRPPRAEP